MDMGQAADLVGTLPHCDQRVMHAPKECKYCDACPKLQALRVVWGIAFTGHEALEGQLPCPSDAARGTGGAHVWPGNVPSK